MPVAVPGVPLAGIEPALSAPEADALSAELQGRVGPGPVVATGARSSEEATLVPRGGRGVRASRGPGRDHVSSGHDVPPRPPEPTSDTTAPSGHRPVRDRLAEAVAAAVSTAAAEGGLDLAVEPGDVHLERPASREHGDWSTNIALVTAKRAGTNPRELAAALVGVLERDLPTT